MWILTSTGFFSIVRKHCDVPAGTLTVRGRVRGDLERLRSGYLPDASPIEEDFAADYRYRFRVDAGELASVLGRIVTDIDYDNFKEAVELCQGHERHDIYLAVWLVMRKLSCIDAAGGSPY